MVEAVIISALNLVLVVLLLGEFPPVGFLMLLFWAMSFGGAVGYYFTQRRPFAILSFVGFVLFFPISLIGIVGVRKMMNRHELAQLGAAGQPDQVYIYNQRNVWGFLILGIISIIVEIGQRFIFSASVGIAGVMGAALIIAFFYFRRLHVLRISEPYFVLQTDPMTSVKVVFNRDITRIRTGKKLAQIWTAGQEKPLAIRWDLFGTADRDGVRTFLQSIPREKSISPSP